MRNKIPPLRDFLSMDKADVIEIFFGDLHDYPYIRAKMSAKPEYVLSEEYIHDVIERMLIKYDNDTNLARAKLEEKIVEVENISALIAAEKRRVRLDLTTQQLPDAAKFLLYFSVPEDCIGDLEELYQKIARDRGVREATIWLWCQVAKSVFHFAFAAILRAIKLSDLLDWIFKTL